MTGFVWPTRLLDALDGALEYAVGHDRATIENAVDVGMVQFWEGWGSFCLTELKVSPTGRKTVHLFLAGGTQDELYRLYPVIEAWAKQQGAVAVTMLGRKGWERTHFTQGLGFRPTLTFYEKELV